MEDLNVKRETTTTSVVHRNKHFRERTEVKWDKITSYADDIMLIFADYQYS